MRFFNVIFLLHLTLSTAIAADHEGTTNQVNWSDRAQRINALADRDDYLEVLRSGKTMAQALGITDQQMSRWMAHIIIKQSLSQNFLQRRQAAIEWRSQRVEESLTLSDQKRAEMLNQLAERADYLDVLVSTATMGEALEVSAATVSNWISRAKVAQFLTPTFHERRAEAKLNNQEEALIAAAREKALQINEIFENHLGQQMTYKFIAARLKVSVERTRELFDDPLVQFHLSKTALSFRSQEFRTGRYEALRDLAARLNNACEDFDFPGFQALAREIDELYKTLMVALQRPEIWPLLSETAVQKILALSPAMRANFRLRITALIKILKDHPQIMTSQITQIPHRTLSKWSRNNRIVHVLRLPACDATLLL